MTIRGRTELYWTRYKASPNYMCGCVYVLLFLFFYFFLYIYILSMYCGYGGIGSDDGGYAETTLYIRHISP